MSLPPPEHFLHNILRDNPDIELIDSATHDLSGIDQAFMENGRVRLLPAAAWKCIDPTQLRLWCCLRGRYGIPTVELVEFLKDRIAGRKAIEVAAGMGDLGFHLGIPMTDSYFQTDPIVASYYAGLGQAPIRPPPDVLEMDAQTAVRRLKPRVVIASWLTQQSRPGETQGCVGGANEQYILDRAAYFFVGNHRVHSEKRILSRPCETTYASWIISRAIKPELNVIYIWDPDSKSKIGPQIGGV